MSISKILAAACRHTIVGNRGQRQNVPSRKLLRKYHAKHRCREDLDKLETFNDLGVVFTGPFIWDAQ